MLLLLSFYKDFLLLTTKTMTQKNIMIFFLVLVGLFGVMWWGKGNQSSNPEEQVKNKSQLIVAESVYDFGTISMANGNVSQIFKVTNQTNKNIFISNLTTSCMCTNAYIVKSDGSKKGPFGMTGMGYVPKADETIKAGETRNIEVVYDPNAHGPAGVGLVDRFIYLDDTDGGRLQLEIKARVTP